ncbi:unnamed protein product, partial [Adineta steineri]
MSEFLIRIKTSDKNINDYNKIISLRIYDDKHQSSEEIILKKSEIENENINIYHIRIQQKLNETIQRLKLHSIQIHQQQQSEDDNKNERIFLKWIELNDLSTNRTFCFPINDYLPSSPGDVLELTKVYQDKICETNTDNQTLFKIRTRVGHKGLLAFHISGTDVKVYIRLYEGEKVSDDILLNNSLTHNNPFESGHTDVFEIGVSQDIRSPDRIEIFSNEKKHDGLYLKWIEIMNMNTLERKCFPVNRSIDFKEESHIILTNFIIDESCEENEYREHHIHDQYKTEYIVRTKTSLNQPLNKSNAHANIYLKIYDHKNKHTEDMLLSNSKHQTNPFQAGQIDKFHIGSIQLMDDSIDKIELWHDNKSNFNWFCQWIEIKNKKTDSIKCFGVNRLLSQKLILTIHSNYPCDKTEHELYDFTKNVAIDNQYSHFHTSNKNEFIKKYLIKIKTGNKSLSTTNAHVFIRLYDNENRSSEDILLDQTIINKIPFQKHAVDEFQSGTLKNLSDLQKIRLWYTDGKNEKWNIEWLQVNDIDANRLYCFPVNKRFDSNSDDIVLTEYTINEPCSTISSQYKRTYHVETKTGKRGFLNLSPTGTNSNVYMRIHDKNGQISEPIELNKSLNHKNKFERGQTDEFDVGSIQSLDEINKLELWHDNSGIGRGWFVDYIAITDNKTGDEACFFIGEYLNKENGGIEEKHLILDKQTVDNRPCREHQFDGDELTIDETVPTVFKQTYRIETKTGQTGTNIPVFIRIYDNNDKISEPIQLKNSLNHKNKFERGQTDQFDVGTRIDLEGVKKLELWYENDGWQIDYIVVIDNKTKDSYCFVNNAMVNKNSDSKNTRILLEYPSINVLCSKNNDKIERNFTIKTKTGNHIEAGSTTPIHIQLFDDQEQKSEYIRLKQQDHDKHNFEPGAIDEFEVTSFQQLSNKLIGIRVKHNANKYQGWYCEWIEITDKDNNKTYCYPIQRWIDKAENDKKTDIYFTDVSNVPCHTMSQLSTISFKNTYYIKSKTGKNNFPDKGIFIRIIDKNGNISENLQLNSSTEHIGTSKQLNSIDQIELWTDGKDFNSGWLCEYIKITDNQTGDVACFPVNQCLNQKNGGIERNPLELKRIIGDRSCQELIVKNNTNDNESISKYKSTYSIITKTGQTGTNAPVFIRIHDTKGKISEAIQLENSTRHTNKFERNQIDQFDIGTLEMLEGISRVELWHEGNKNNGWQVEYIQLIDNQTNTSYCFPVHGLRQTHILLERPLINVSCSEQMNTDIISPKKMKKTKDKYERNFTIRTKTGNQIEASSTTPIHIQLFDDQEQSSEDIRLKYHDHDKHNFEPGAIDEFQVTSHQPLSNKLTGIRIKHNADKYQGWYCEWIEIIDEDNQQTYCYSIQRWIDKAENDKKTDVYFNNLSNVPCNSLSNTMISITQKLYDTESHTSQRSFIPYQSTYHVETKTGKKGFLSLSPTGTNAAVYIQIIDHDGSKSEPMQLKKSIDHNNQFERGQTDEFDIGSIKQLNGIKQLEIWTNEKGLGHGWYADYIIVTDNKTNEEACFLIDAFLNKKNGGVIGNHLILNKETNSISCREKYQEKEDDIDTIQTRQMKAIRPVTDSSSMILYKRTYNVNTKTGHKGSLDTDIDVHLRIYDKTGHISEPISLRRSTKHSNPFEKGNLDSFDIGTKESLESIAKIELYHDGTSVDREWNMEYITILDNLTGHTYCFSSDKLIRNSEHIIFDVPCEDINKEQMKSKIIDTKDKQKRSFSVQTKTGSHVEAGSTTPIYLRLFDDQFQKSEKIRLKQKDKDGHHFQSGSIDEFHITSDKPFNKLTAIEVSHTADKYQGWYGEWISITDNDTNEIYCFPLQRWLDKGELDGKTDVYLKYIPTTIPCEQLPDTMKRRSLLRTIPIEKLESKNSIEEYKTIYHVQIKTAKKGLLGLAPTGTDANVFIQIHDNNGNISEPIELKESIDHKNKFARGKIDDFDVGSIHELNGVDKLELWTDGKGIGNGWFPEYVQITDQKTGEISCFIIEQYLNEKYGGVKNDHLIFSKQKDNRLCNELKNDDTLNSSEKERFQVEIKTGLNEIGTDTAVFIQIYDNNDRKSDVFQLKHSTKHRNKFQRNQTDNFLIDTEEPLDGVSKLDLWYKGNKNDKWQVDYINITDNKTNISYCFPINTILDLTQSNLHFENPLINVSCKEENELSYTSISKKLKSDRLSRNYTVQTKTGNHPSAGSTTPIHLQLIDIYDKKSKDIRLKKKDMEGHHFAPGNIDEFKISLSESLSILKAIKLSLDADKYQGWYGEWISITDDDTNEIYCFPIQRWLDKGENDHKTHVILYQQSASPCHQLPDSMLISSSPINNEENMRTSTTDQEFQICTQTADKSLQGKPGHNVNVYLNLYDKNNKQLGDSIRLENSKNHKIPFQKHHTDKFNI